MSTHHEAPSTGHGHSDEGAPTVPNHHADHPGLDGFRGLVAALSMTVGRDGDANWAAELAGLRPGDHVVDVGCGPGVAARYAAARGATVVGVDPSSVTRRVGSALTRRHASVTYVDGLAERMPVETATATVVWTIASVHHWPDLGAALAEIRRVLTPDGRFVAIERRILSGANGLASHGWTDEQADGFAACCRDAGFEVVGVQRRQVGRRSLVAVTANRGS
jgi:SAM-dependent methyltransferase